MMMIKERRLVRRQDSFFSVWAVQVPRACVMKESMLLLLTSVGSV